MLFAVLLALFALALPQVAPADEQILMACRDNTLFEDADGDTSNGVGPALYSGTNAQERMRRALLQFDFTVIPLERRIERVTLVLHVTNAPDSITRSFRLHRVVRPWGEGTSSSSGGSGAQATTGDATWMHAFWPALRWDRAGGDFLDAASAVGPCNAGPCAWSSASMADDVRAWRADPAVNHGWILVGEETGARTVRRFDARESPSLADRPVLVLTLSAPDPLPVPATAGSWGRLKVLYR